MNLLQKAALVLLFVLSVCGCDKKPQIVGPKYENSPPQSDKQSYVLAVHPLHNPQKLLQTYQPLADYLSKMIHVANFEVEPSKDYGSFEAKIKSRTTHFLLPNPLQTLEAMKAGYGVIAMAGNPEDFKGIFIVRRDSAIRTPADLKGKIVSYPASTALAACIMPQYFLQNNGINVNTEIENRYVGSQESSIMTAYLGQVSAGATWPRPWRSFLKDHPKEAAELKVMWETPHLINNSFMVRNDVPDEIRAEVRSILLQLHLTTEGKAILAGMETDRFYPASDDDYGVVRHYLAGFEKNVRLVIGGKK